MNFIKSLELPVPPTELIKNNIDMILSGKSTIQMTDNFICKTLTKDGKIINGSKYTRYVITPELKTWVTDNILPKNMNTISCGIQVFANQSLPFNGTPHIDGIRGKRILNFIIKTGGESVDTVWYQQKNHELYRKYNFENPRTNNFENYNDLEEVFRARAIENTWTIIESKIIHGIENMNRPRVSLSIGVSDDDVDAFCKFHQLDQSETFWKMER
jgi:hypothetical protein